MLVKLFFTIVAVVFSLQMGCTSDADSDKKTREPIEEDYEDEGDEGAVAAKSSRTSATPRIPKALMAGFNRSYRVDLKFEKLVSAVEKATGAVSNVNSIYEFDLIYDLFPAGDSKPQGQAVVIAKEGEKYYTLTSKARSKVRKHLYYGKPSEGGHCGACFLNMEQIHFQLGVAYYLKRGKSSGFYATNIKFVKDKKGMTRILPNIVLPAQLKSVKKRKKYVVTKFNLSDEALELTYLDPSKGTYRINIKLNRTLDTEIFLKARKKKKFQSVARFFGGVLPPYAASQE